MSSTPHHPPPLPSTDSFLAVEQAITALRCGAPVMLGDGAKQLVISSVEHPQDIPDATTCTLLLSSHRVSTILPPPCPAPMVVECPAHQLALLAGLTPQPGAFPDVKAQIPEETALADAAIQLAKYAQLLPALLIHDATAVTPACTLNIATVTSYDQSLTDILHIVCEGPLTLTHAPDARMVVFRAGHQEHYAIMVGNPSAMEHPLVRIHSSCFTGDTLASLTCDCGEQLRESLTTLHQHGGGVILYLLQEGRGIGLANKLRAYSLQAQGMDTVDANRHLGFEDDERPYGLAARMLQLLDITSLRLITNNPRKLDGLVHYGIQVEGRIPLIIPPREANDSYLTTKFSRLGHLRDSSE